MGPDVELHVDTARPPTFDIQHAHLRDGRLTADTLLDRVVFGSPIMAEDMWGLCRLHEISRRRSGECGLDVIVASAQRRHGQCHKRQPMMTAEAAAHALVQLARKLDPEGELATAAATFQDVSPTAEVLGVDEDLRLRAPDLSCLKKFEDGMRDFLSKPRTIKDIQAALKNIWRGKNHAVEDESFAAALRTAFTWSKTPRVRLLLFLRSAGFHVSGEQVTEHKPAADAIECVRKCGTPVYLLEAYYRQLGVKLVLMNGSRCAQIWEPDDWASRGHDD